MAVPYAGEAADSEGAYKTLVNAPSFALGGVGIAGIITPTEIACRTIMKSADATPIFAKVLEHGTPAGKMYALCGLYYKSPEIYQKAAAPYRTSQKAFESAAGCMILQATFASEVHNLEGKQFDQLLKDLPRR